MDVGLSAAWVLLLALIGIIILVLKRVTTPTPPPSPILTLALDKVTLDKGSDLTLSGTLTLSGVGQSNKTVAIAIIPPSGDGYTYTALTDSTGKFTKVFTPSTSDPAGSWKAGVSYAGATSVEKTFIMTQLVMLSRRTVERRIDERWLMHYFKPF